MRYVTNTNHENRRAEEPLHHAPLEIPTIAAGSSFNHELLERQRNKNRSLENSRGYSTCNKPKRNSVLHLISPRSHDRAASRSKSLARAHPSPRNDRAPHKRKFGLQKQQGISDVQQSPKSGKASAFVPLKSTWWAWLTRIQRDMDM